MSGKMGEVGRAIGRSGGDPFCVNAVYHFPDLSLPVNVATFTDGEDEGRAEFEAVRLALENG
jgi:D-alanyl-D-alanine carboxypeptidase